MVFSEILGALRSGTALPLTAISNLRPSVIDYHSSLTQLHRNDCISTFVHEDSIQTNVINIEMGQYVDFFFTYSGGTHITLKDRISSISDVDVLIIINGSDALSAEAWGEKTSAELHGAPRCINR